MISPEAFREAVWGMTGRPEIPVAPYLANTLAAISRSGQYPEDIVTIYRNVCSDSFVELPSPGYHRLAGWRLAGIPMPAPDGLSVRRVIEGTVEYETQEGASEPLTLLSSSSPSDFNRMMRECGTKPVLSYTAGQSQLLIPPNQWKSKAPEGYYDTVGISLIMLTSNESRGFNFGQQAGGHGNFYAGGTGNWFGEEPDAVEPWPTNDPQFIWQLESCLDLVILGTSAAVMRFAGQEKEGALMYQEFLINLRQYSRDRGDALVDAPNALGY